MGRTHPSTPEMRAQAAALLLAHQGEYGIVTHLSRTHHVSRPTLYAWREHAREAMVAAFSPPPPQLSPPATARHILTLWITHASHRGIQAATQELLGQSLSLPAIVAVLHQAQQRALAWMHAHVPPSTRTLALDEIFPAHGRAGYLNVVDVQSGAVWASEGPLSVDSESWTLLLWALQERGLRWQRVVMDDGAPMHSACQHATPDVLVQLDHWHLFHACAQVQAHVQRHLSQLHARTATVERQSACLERGARQRGRPAKSTLATHTQELAAASSLAAALAYVTTELHRLLAVVVVERERLLTLAERHGELEALLSLLDELAASSAASQQAELGRLARRIRRQLPKLLSFGAQLEQVQQGMTGVLAVEHQALLGWAWLRRQELGWSEAEMLAAVPADWRAAARVLLRAWEEAVLVSSAVERWHSILRPHLAVRRRLTNGMLALLAVWHNHRVFSRGVHKGQSPLHLSGMTDAPTDWLVALGYPPASAEGSPAASMPEWVLAA
jgi:transposase-like protein